MKFKHIFFIAFLIVQLNQVFGQTDSTRFFKTTQGALIYDPYFSIGTEYSWDGETKNGFAEGEGTCRFMIEDKVMASLTGMFSKGQATGMCTFIDNYLENELKCNYTSGRMLGIGTLKTIDSDLYTGELRDLTIHGVGKMVYSNGSVFEGSFKQGSYWTGTFLDLNDKTSFFYQQETVDSLPTYSKYSPPLNQEVTEYFDDYWNRCKKNEASYYRKITYSKPNMPSGEIKEFFISGNISSKYFASYVNYNDERMTFYGPGPMKFFYENGYLQYEHDYNYKGLYEGLYKAYHENGMLKKKCYYINNMVSGNRLDYDDKGLLSHYAVYENGDIQDGKYYSYEDNLWTAEYDENFKNNFSFWDPKDKNIYTSILDDGGFYAKFEEDKKAKTVKMSVAVDLGGSYLTSSLDKDKFKFVEKMVKDFAVKMTKEPILAAVKEAEKQLEKLQDKQKDLEKDNKDLKEDIEDYKKKIYKAEKEVIEKDVEIDKKKSEVKIQKKVVDASSDAVSEQAKSSKKILDKLEDQLKDSEKDSKNLKEDIEDNKKKITKAEKEIKTNEEDQVKKKAEIETQIKVVADTKKKLDAVN